MDKFELVFLCTIFALVALIIYCAINYKKIEVNAEPITTEIPEFSAKCTKFSFTLNICEEYTIYRITRN